MALSAETVPPDCPEDAEGKDGLCGHAMAATAKFKHDGMLPPPYVDNAEAADDTDVTHCHLDIEVDPVAKTVTGSNTLSVTSRTGGLTQFTLDLRSNMTVDAVLVNGSAATYTRPTNQVRLNLDRAYSSGESLEVQVAYHGTPLNLNWGSFSFGEHFGSPIVASLSEPWYAHTWWPCKEAIHDKFTMDIWVTVPDWMIVASNGRLLGTDSLPDSRKRYRWQESYPISVYLVSVAMTNYTKWTEWYVHPGGTMPVEFYLYPEEQDAVLPLLTGAAGVVTMIETFSAPGIFGEYPFIDEKYGIARFEWCCGMEHQTITSQGNFDERRTVHELAHSWWGNDVTCKTWHDIWLNEGFARYAEALWYEKRPAGGYSAYLNHLLAYRPGYHGQNGTVYRYDISNPDFIFSSTYAYDKGAWVLHMLRHVLGDAVFFQTLAQYRQAFSGGAADTQDFKAIAEVVSGRDLDWFFNQWVYQNGAPYYRYGWQSAQIGGRQWARVYIQQYQTSYPNFKMPIDVTVWTASGSETRAVWQEADDQWYLLPSDQLVTNVQLDRDTWILRGAASPVAYAGGPPKLVAAAPAPGTSHAFDPQVSAVELQFSEPVTHAAGDFSVVGSVTGSVPFTIDAVPAEYRLTLSFASPLPASQTWTVRIADTLRSQAATLSLDGEISGALPSGDGIPGGAAEFSFTVGPPLAPCPDPFADADDDGDVDQVDFGVLQTCFTGDGDPAATYDVLGCHCWDHDGDDDVDAADFDAFIACASGPSVPADPGCDG